MRACARMGAPVKSPCGVLWNLEAQGPEVKGIRALGEALGLRGPILRPLLDGRFFLEGEVGLWEWRYPFPYPGEAVVILDLETTGLTPGPDGVMEIGLVRLEGGRRLTFQSLVRPKRPPSPYVARLTGLIPPHAGLRLHGGPGRKVLVEFLGTWKRRNQKQRVSPLRSWKGLPLGRRFWKGPTPTSRGPPGSSTAPPLIPPHAGLRQNIASLTHGDPGRKVPVRFFGNLRAQEPKVKGMTWPSWARPGKPWAAPCPQPWTPWP